MLATRVKEKFYSTLGTLKANPWPLPSMQLNAGDLSIVWDLETTGLSIYQQEPMKIGYAICR